jgi:hypothetical protein
MTPDGFILSILLGSFPLTFLASLWLLRRFRKRMATFMQADSGYRPEPELDLVPSAGPERRALTIHSIQKTSGINNLARTTGNRIQLALVYGIAGGLYAVAYTYLYFVSGDLEFFPLRIAILYTAFAFPALLLILQLWVRKPWMQWVGMGLLYALLFLPVATQISLGSYAFLIGWLAGIPYLFYGLVRWRNYRTIGPMVWALSYGLLTALMLSMNAMLTVGTQLPDLGETGLILAFIATIALYVLFARIMVRLGVKSYQRKRSSDWIIQADITFLLFGIWQVNLMYLNQPKAGLWAIGLLAGYKLLQVLLMRMFIRPNSTPTPLLLLRVFGFRQRSEQLLDHHLFSWRFRGPIHMIAGTDLAAETLEPHEFFSFLGGNMKSMFVKSGDELRYQLAQLDEKPDPDGRYRINDFFCFDNVWKEALRSLLDRSTFVLMDLRGFHPGNQGCIFEIEQLLEHVPLTQLAFLTDATTDLPFLKKTFLAVWDRLPADAPNLELEDPKIHLYENPKGVFGG